MYLRNSSSRPVYRRAIRAALLGLLVNLLLGVVKLAGGIVGNSFALISDAVNSLADCLTSCVVTFGLWFAQKPGDAEHPYGHTRAEAVAASSVALVIISSAIYVGWEALQRIGTPRSEPPLWTLGIAAANVVIKESLYRYKLGIGRSTGSLSLIVNAWDHRADALCSLAVLIGLSCVRFGGPKFAVADEIAALFVVVAVLWTGLMLYRHSVSELMDLQADDALVSAIRGSAERVPGVKAVEKLWVRKTGLEYLADMHIEVDGKKSVEEGHRIAHEVKDQLLDEFVTLRDVLVHLEPYPNVHRDRSSG